MLPERGENNDRSNFVIVVVRVNLYSAHSIIVKR